MPQPAAGQRDLALVQFTSLAKYLIGLRAERLLGRDEGECRLSKGGVVSFGPYRYAIAPRPARGVMGDYGRGGRPAPSFEASKSIRSSATRSAAMSLSSNRSYVAPRTRGGFSGG